MSTKYWPESEQKKADEQEQFSAEARSQRSPEQILLAEIRARQKLLDPKKFSTKKVTVK